MLFWLIALPCLISANLAPDVLPADIMAAIFSIVGFTGLCSTSCVSRDFSQLSKQAIASFCSIRHDKSTYLNYTLILHELDAIVREVSEDHSVSEASKALRSSPHFMCAQSVLQAGFGYCIEFSAKHLPKFYHHDLSFDTLNDKQRISVLPYVLDQTADDSRWIHFVRGLAELGRLDLFQQVTFSRITSARFNKLMSVTLPESVMLTAAESLQRNEPDLELASLFDCAASGGETSHMPAGCRIPLFALKYLHEKSVAIPQSCVLTNGLDDASISFWVYVLKIEASEAERLLRLVREQGDEGTKYLANTFYPPTFMHVPSLLERDVYQAMLIRFHSSPISNEHVVRHYTDMLAGLQTIDHHTICALLDCRQFQIAEKHRFTHVNAVELSALMDRTFRSKDDTLNPFIRNCLLMLQRSAKLLKCLVCRKADQAYVQLAWSSIQERKQHGNFTDFCCYAPLEALERLVFEKDISIDAVKGLLGMLDEVYGPGVEVTKEAHILYTVMFWEAPENVIEHFLDMVPEGCMLEQEALELLLRSTKYSAQFWKKLIERFGAVDSSLREEIATFRPDLVEQLNL